MSLTLGRKRMSRPSLEDLVQLIHEGAGVRFNASDLTIAQLVELGAQAGGLHSKITIVVDLRLKQADLMRIAEHARGAVDFDFG